MASSTSLPLSAAFSKSQKKSTSTSLPNLNSVVSSSKIPTLANTLKTTSSTTSSQKIPNVTASNKVLGAITNDTSNNVLYDDIYKDFVQTNDKGEETATINLSDTDLLKTLVEQSEGISENDKDKVKNKKAGFFSRMMEVMTGILDPTEYAIAVYRQNMDLQKAQKEGDKFHETLLSVPVLGAMADRLVNGLDLIIRGNDYGAGKYSLGEAIADQKQAEIDEQRERGNENYAQYLEKELAEWSNQSVFGENTPGLIAAFTSPKALTSMLFSQISNRALGMLGYKGISQFFRDSGVGQNIDVDTQVVSELMGDATAVEKMGANLDSALLRSTKYDDALQDFIKKSLPEAFQQITNADEFKQVTKQLIENNDVKSLNNLYSVLNKHFSQSNVLSRNIEYIQNFVESMQKNGYSADDIAEYLTDNADVISRRIKFGLAHGMSDNEVFSAENLLSQIAGRTNRNLSKIKIGEEGIDTVLVNGVASNPNLDRETVRQFLNGTMAEDKLKGYVSAAHKSLNLNEEGTEMMREAKQNFAEKMNAAKLAADPDEMVRLIEEESPEKVLREALRDDASKVLHSNLSSYSEKEYKNLLGEERLEGLSPEAEAFLEEELHKGNSLARWVKGMFRRVGQVKDFALQKLGMRGYWDRNDPILRYIRQATDLDYNAGVIQNQTLQAFQPLLNELTRTEDAVFGDPKNREAIFNNLVKVLEDNATRDLNGLSAGEYAQILKKAGVNNVMSAVLELSHDMNTGAEFEPVMQMIRSNDGLRAFYNAAEKLSDTNKRIYRDLGLLNQLDEVKGIYMPHVSNLGRRRAIESLLAERKYSTLLDSVKAFENFDMHTKFETDPKLLYNQMIFDTSSQMAKFEIEANANAITTYGPSLISLNPTYRNRIDRNLTTKRINRASQEAALTSGLEAAAAKDPARFSKLMASREWKSLQQQYGFRYTIERIQRFAYEDQENLKALSESLAQDVKKIEQSGVDVDSRLQARFNEFFDDLAASLADDIVQLSNDRGVDLAKSYKPFLNVGADEVDEVYAKLPFLEELRANLQNTLIDQFPGASENYINRLERLGADIDNEWMIGNRSLPEFVDKVFADIKDMEASNAAPDFRKTTQALKSRPETLEEVDNWISSLDRVIKERRYSYATDSSMLREPLTLRKELETLRRYYEDFTENIDNDMKFVSLLEGDTPLEKIEDFANRYQTYQEARQEFLDYLGSFTSRDVRRLSPALYLRTIPAQDGTRRISSLENILRNELEVASGFKNLPQVAGTKLAQDLSSVSVGANALSSAGINESSTILGRYNNIINDIRNLSARELNATTYNQYLDSLKQRTANLERFLEGSFDVGSANFSYNKRLFGDNYNPEKFSTLCSDIRDLLNRYGLSDPTTGNTAMGQVFEESTVRVGGLLSEELLDNNANLRMALSYLSNQKNSANALTTLVNIENVDKQRMVASMINTDPILPDNFTYINGAGDAVEPSIKFRNVLDRRTGVTQRVSRDIRFSEAFRQDPEGTLRAIFYNPEEEMLQNIAEGKIPLASKELQERAAELVKDVRFRKQNLDFGKVSNLDVLDFYEELPPELKAYDLVNKSYRYTDSLGLNRMGVQIAFQGLAPSIAPTGLARGMHQFLSSMRSVPVLNTFWKVCLDCSKILNGWALQTSSYVMNNIIPNTIMVICRANAATMLPGTEEYESMVRIRGIIKKSMELNDELGPNAVSRATMSELVERAADSLAGSWLSNVTPTDEEKQIASQLLRTNVLKDRTLTRAFTLDYGQAVMAMEGMNVSEPAGLWKRFVNFSSRDLFGFQALAENSDLATNISLYKQFLKEGGGSTDYALQKFNEFFITYKQLSAPEQFLARHVMSFWTFNRQNMINVYREMFTNPTFMRRMNMVTDVMTAAQQKEVRELRSKLPSDNWRNTPFWVGNQDIMFESFQTPLSGAIDFSRMLGLNGFPDALKRASEQLNVPASIIIGFLTDKDPRTGKTISGRDGDLKLSAQTMGNVSQGQGRILDRALPQSIKDMIGFAKSTDPVTLKTEYTMNPWIYFVINKNFTGFLNKIQSFIAEDSKVDGQTLAKYILGLSTSGKAAIASMESNAYYAQREELWRLLVNANVVNASEDVYMNDVQKQLAGIMRTNQSDQLATKLQEAAARYGRSGFDYYALKEQYSQELKDAAAARRTYIKPTSSTTYANKLKKATKSINALSDFKIKTGSLSSSNRKSGSSNQFALNSVLKG